MAPPEEVLDIPLVILPPYTQIYQPTLYVIHLPIGIISDLNILIFNPETTLKNKKRHLKL
jgi:hypothetical protein